jgi:cytochrome c oxidase assembly protein subunit 11
VSSEQQRQANAKLLRRLLVVAGCSFAFAFALVPAYRIACEKVFGIKLDQDAATVAPGTYAVDESRVVTVQFDSSVAAGLPWRFAPQVASLKVHPGQQVEALFTATNTGVADVVGQAVPSVAPNVASIYFSKTECFCFTEQKLAAGETREMPVRFVVDPALPDTISTLTLSYTFYLNDVATQRLAEAPAG